MNFKTLLYPVYINKIGGKWIVGFITGEINAKNKFFENAGVIERIFAKKPNFAFLQPVKCMVCVPNEKVDDRKRLLSGLCRKNSEIEILADDLHNVSIVDGEEEENG